MEINEIFENNKKWVEKKLNEDENYFTNLAKGQSPEILFIGCSDSRVTAETIIGAEPGDIFVYRNIANMVSNLDLSAMSVIEYAVVNLKVKHIIVTGHYECGGVKAAMTSKDYAGLNPWLRNIKDVYRLHKDELDNIKDEHSKYNKLVELNVREQCINVLKTSSVQKAYREGNIKIHGWVWDIHTGKLIDLKIDFDSILNEIMEIYHLDLPVGIIFIVSFLLIFPDAVLMKLSR